MQMEEIDAFYANLEKELEDSKRFMEFARSSQQIILMPQSKSTILVFASDTIIGTQLLTKALGCRTIYAQGLFNGLVNSDDYTIMQPLISLL